MKLPSVPLHIRAALRHLRKSPSFTITAVLSLALGIGASAAVFTLIDNVLFQALPVHRPEQLYVVTGDAEHRKLSALPYDFLTELRARRDVLLDALAIREIAPHFSTNGPPEMVRGECVSGNYFEMLGVRPYAGRLLGPADETAPGADRVAVLGYVFWKTRFGADVGILGKSITLNGIRMTVIGISPPSYDSLRIGYSPDVRVPMTMWPQLSGGNPSDFASPARWRTYIICRLRPPTTEKRAESALNVWFQSYRERTGTRGRRITTLPDRLFLRTASHGLPSIVMTAAWQLYALVAIVAIVLCAVCVNLANLFFARTVSRQHEVAIKFALGATRGALIEESLVQLTVLVTLGASIGALASFFFARFLVAYLPTSVLGPISIPTEPNLPIVVAVAIASLATAATFGLAPTIQLVRCESVCGLKGQGRRFSPAAMNWRRGLISMQVALSVVLSVGAILFARSLANAANINTGFDSHNLMQVSLDPPGDYQLEKLRIIYREINRRVSEASGIVSASFARQGPLQGGCDQQPITIDGQRSSDGDAEPCQELVGQAYFTTTRTPIIQGRDFTTDDNRPSARKVAIVNEKFSRVYFGARNAIGRYIRQDSTNYEVVGVAKDTKYANLKAETQAVFYIPYPQASSLDNLTLFFRTVVDPRKRIEAVRRTIASIDPAVATYNVRTLDQRKQELLAKDQMLAISAAFLGLMTLMAAGIGLHGLIQFMVVQRRQEIAIRTALGAHRIGALRPIARGIGAALLTGIVLGGGGAVLSSRFAAALLFEVKPTDPITLLTACLLVIVVAVSSAYIPARRAVRIDTMIALSSPFS